MLSHSLRRFAAVVCAISLGLLAAAAPVSGAAHPSSNPAEISLMGSRVYFAADTESHGRELWTSDGTPGGTHEVKDINPAGGSFPEQLTVVGNRLFFAAYDGAGYKLWVSNGTEVGTIALTGVLQPSLLRKVGDTLFFINEAFDDPEVWTSDGTPGGTDPVLLVPNAGEVQWEGGAAAFQGQYYFVVRQSVPDDQWWLWRSDGTAGGTEAVAAAGLPLDEDGPFEPRELVASGGLLYFRVTGSGDGGYDSDDLWKSNGTAPGTRKVKDLDGIQGSDYARDLTNVNGTLFFTNRDDELWKSNGTRSGTKLVKVVNAFASRAPVSLTKVGSWVFFQSYTSATASDLWRTRGTAATTAMVDAAAPYACWDRDGPPNPNDPDCNHDLDYAPAAVGSRVFFPSADGGKGIELWVSDGTEAGTYMVKNIRTGSLGSGPSDLASDGTLLFFVANDGAHGREPWVSDGTPSGTHLLMDINPG